MEIFHFNSPFDATVSVSIFNFPGVIAWFILFSIVGDSAYPGGPVFDLIALIVAAHIGGFLSL